MEEIKPSYSFILNPDEKFLNSEEVKQILGNFRDLKKQIMMNQNYSGNFFNSIFKDDSSDEDDDNDDDDNDNDDDDDYYNNSIDKEEDNENMDVNIWKNYHKLKSMKYFKCLPKRGVSLMTPKERKLIKQRKYNINQNFSSRKSISHGKLNMHKDDYKIKEIKIRKKKRKKYNKLIKEIFCEKINDFRSEIIIYCLKNTEILDDDNFENFVCFLEFFISLFTGIKTKYYLDELTNLNMDFYCDERNLMNLAETFRYQVQFRIKDLSIIYDSSSKIYKKRDGKIVNIENFNITKFLEINELNKVEFENYNWKEPDYYPPFTNFIKELSAHYKRFDLDDRVHICKECENISNEKNCLNLKCNSSCFKSIDKERLIHKSLMTIMSENNIDDCWIIKDNILMPNYPTLIQRISTFSLIATFLIPFETKKTVRINKIFCNVFGEGIGFFFVWISHYISWLVFPAILGLILHIFLFINKKQKLNGGKDYELETTLFFTGMIVLWSNYYVLSWKKMNIFYNHIWGINNFKLKKGVNGVDKDSRVSKNKINFMGIVLPPTPKFKTKVVNILIVILSFLIKLFVMGSNAIVLTFKNHKFHLKNVFYNNLLNKYWKYINPIIIYIFREIFSVLSEKANIWLYKHQKFISENEKYDMLVQKKLIFEFFNYYFNLYYIAFFKKYFEKCLYDNCYKELEEQLIVIIMSDAIVICVKIYINVISLRKQKNKFEKEIQSKYLYMENNSKKFRYYTRYPFKDDSIVQFYLQIFLTFGYIIQFGASCPISFILVLFITILTRVALGISLRDIYYAQTQSVSIGLNLINQAQELITFIGIISNLFIIFYTNESFVKIKTFYKFFYMILTENIIILITQFIEPFSLPKWFNYRNKIAIKYYRKYGTRKKRIMNNKFYN